MTFLFLHPASSLRQRGKYASKTPASYKCWYHCKRMEAFSPVNALHVAKISPLSRVSKQQCMQSPSMHVSSSRRDRRHVDRLRFRYALRRCCCSRSDPCRSAYHHVGRSHGARSGGCCDHRPWAMPWRVSTRGNLFEPQRSRTQIPLAGRHPSRVIRLPRMLGGGDQG